MSTVCEIPVFYGFTATMGECQYDPDFLIDTDGHVVLNPPRTRQDFTPEALEKAQQLLIETIGQKHYDAFINGEEITVKNGELIFKILDQEGHIERIKPKLVRDESLKGRLLNKKIETVQSSIGRLNSYDMPLEDQVASFYIWAKENPDDLDRKWKCGQITI